MNEQRFVAPSSNGVDSGGKQLCLLSLDGGGVRGLSSLQILKQLMELINPKDPPKPCDYFNMIGGTSTGGLIAIMLGRLEMSVDECIIEYRKLADDVFTKCKHRLTWRGKVQGRFDHEALAEGICDLLERRGLDRNALLKDPSESAFCKTFVCTTSKETSETVILTSYYSERWGTDLLKVTKIWEAARATSAATSFFDEIEIDGQKFVDGATGANNPVNEIWTEASFLWRESNSFSLEKNLKCLVSVGTGMPSLKPFGNSIGEVATILLAIATDTERKGETFHKQYDNLFRTGVAFRFNVLQGLEDVGLEEATKQGEIMACTKRYIAKQHVLDSMKLCATNLRQCENFATLLKELCRDDLVAYEQCSQYWLYDEMQTFTNTLAFRKWISMQAVSEMLYIKASSGSREKNTSLAASIGKKVLSANGADVLYCRLALDLVAERRAVRSNLARVQMGEIMESEQEKRAKKDSMHERLLTIWRSLISQKLLLAISPHVSVPNCLGKLTEHEVRRVCELLASTDDENRLIGEFGDLSTRKSTIILFDNIDRLPNATFARLCEQLLNLTVGNNVLLLYCGSGELAQNGSFETICDSSEYEECLASLTFDELDRRKAQISEACEGTNTWLWNHSSYKEFEKGGSGLLWIEGKPGSGKSVLAKSIQRRLLKNRGENGTDEAARLHAPRVSVMADNGATTYDWLTGDWYYHGRKGGNYITHNSCVRALLYKLLLQDRSLFGYFQWRYREMGPEHARERWDFKDLFGILEQICTDGTKMICVMDAMDEAEDANILNLCKRLIESPRSQSKFIILSRRSAPIERALGRKKWHILLEAENEDDLREIVDVGLLTLQKEMHALHFEDDEPLKRSRRKVPGRTASHCRGSAKSDLNSREKSSLEEIKLYLNKNARNTILWVKLVLDELRRRVSTGMFTFKELKEILYTMPPKLTEYYRSIVLSLTHGAEHRNLRIARRALMWVSGAEELGLLHLEELWEALAIPESDSECEYRDKAYDCLIEDREPINSFDELRRKLHLMCGPFIEIMQPENVGSQYSSNVGRSVVQLMHQTVKDFLNDAQLAGPLYFHQSDAVEMVKRECERYLHLLLHSWSIALEPAETDTRESTSNSTLEDVAQWLDERSMISFAITKASKSVSCARKISRLYENVFVLPIPTSPAVLNADQELIDALTEDRYMMNRGALEVAKALNYARLIRLACSEGMTVATRNLFAVGSAEPGWWYNQGRVIKDAIAFAASEANSPSYRLTLEREATTHHKVDVPVDDVVGYHDYDAVWQEASWRMLCSSYSTTQPPPLRVPRIEKKTFASPFQYGWCQYLDKVCGGKFYVLEKARQKQRALRTLSFKEDVEHALHYAFSECVAADSLIPPYADKRPASDVSKYPYARLLEDQQELRSRSRSRSPEPKKLRRMFSSSVIERPSDDYFSTDSDDSFFDAFKGTSRSVR